MDIIPLRSPRYEVVTAPATSNSAKLELTIDSTLRYTIIKDCTAGSTVTFEISELCRDYLTDIIMQKTGGYIYPLTQQIEISRSIKFYTGANGTGSLVSTDTATYNAVDGYGDWIDGANYLIPTGATNAFLISKLDGDYEYIAPPNRYIYLGATNTSDDVVNLTNIYSGTSDTTYTYRSSTLTIKIADCSKYTPTLVYFVNKFGSHQPLWFLTKKVEALRTESQTFQQNTIDTSTTTPTYFTPEQSGYPNYPHSVKTFNKNGKKRYILSSGYYPEKYNTYFEELLLSELVWIETETTDVLGQILTSQVMPVRVVTSDFTYKTSLNDRLIEYTIEFEEAVDHINNIR